VEHSCYQCGAEVEDGIPFCPKCSAPQIRVALPEPAVIPSVPAGDDAFEAAPIPYTRAGLANRIDWSQALPSVAWAVLLAAVLTLVTFGSLGLGMLVAGALSVVLYRRRHPNLNLSAWAGARLGALTGALGFGVLLTGLAIAVVGFHFGAKLHDLMITALEQYVTRNPTPQSQQMIELFKTSEGFALMATFGVILTFFACVAFSSAGGALSAVLFRRKNRL
jgi:hypothetical protein